MATLKDVGREAGVGVSTASAVLSRGPQLHQIPIATQDRIRDAARKLKYQPYAGGRQLRRNKTETIAFFQSAEPNHSSLTTDLLYAINDELNRNDYVLNFVRMDDAALKDKSYIPRFLRQKEVDGVLVNYNMHMPQYLVELIHHYEIPTAFMNIKQPENAVYFDHSSPVYYQVKELAKKGHRRIYLLNYTGFFEHYSLHDSQAGYHKAMAELGLEPVILDDNIPYSDRMKVSHDLLTSKIPGIPAPTAVMALALSTAAPLIQAAQQLDVQIPDHLSVITMHGIQSMSSMLTPSPSHIYLPWTKAGEQGVQLLLDLINGSTDTLPSRCVECEWRGADDTVGNITKETPNGRAKV